RLESRRSAGIDDGLPRIPTVCLNSRWPAAIPAALPGSPTARRDPRQSAAIDDDLPRMGTKKGGVPGTPPWLHRGRLLGGSGTGRLRSGARGLRRPLDRLRLAAAERL